MERRCLRDDERRAMLFEDEDVSEGSKDTSEIISLTFLQMIMVKST